MGKASGPAVFGGRWQVVRRLARGGMGVVYVARDLARGEQVALKVLYDKEHDFTGAGHERFVREANASEEIGHPGLVRTLHAGVEQDGTRYIVMELLEGQSLRERMREGLTRRRGLELVLDLLDPLAAAHAKGFVHRDLKPQNALVVRDERGAERVKLLDFGISRRPGVQTVTDVATGMGTPHYAAPEQMQNARAVTSAADVWSTGVLLYRLLTGRLPFEGDAIQMVIRAWEDPHAAVPTLVPGIDPRLSGLVDRCLAKAPDERPPNAGALRAELATLLADSTLALPEDEELREASAQRSAAQTLPAEGTTQERQPAHPPEESTTPDAAADAPAEQAALATNTSGATADEASAAPGTRPSAPPRADTGLRSLPPPPPAPPPPPPAPPELTPAPPRRQARRRRWARTAPALALVALPLFGVAVTAALMTRPEPGRGLHSVPLAQPSMAALSAPVADPAPAPKVPDADGGATSASAKDSDLPEGVTRTVLEEIVLGPANPWVPGADSGARRRARELTSCLPITDAVHGRCFLRALGDRARGEFELRNLVAASLWTGDTARAQHAAARYLREHPRSQYATQIRQIAQNVDASSP